MTIPSKTIILDAFEQLQDVLEALTNDDGGPLFKEVKIGEKEKVNKKPSAYIFLKDIVTREQDTHATQWFIGIVVRMYFVEKSAYYSLIDTINTIGDCFDELMERGTPTTENNRSLGGKINHSYITGFTLKSQAEGSLRMNIADMTMIWETRVPV